MSSALIPHSFQVVPTPSGFDNTTFLDGNDGTGGIPLIFASSIPSLLNQTNSSGVTFNYGLTYLSQPAGNTAVFSWAPGFDPGNGWTISTAGVITVGTVTTNTTVRMRAVRAGVTVDSPQFIVQSNPASTTDTIAPTIPLALTAVQTDATHVTLSVLPGADIKSGSVAAGGSHDVRFYRGGSLLTGSATNTPGVGLSLVPVGIDLGSTPTPGTSVQTLADWVVTASGTQFGGTTDDGQFLFAPIAGDFNLLTEVHSVTGAAAATAVGGLCVLETAVTGSKGYFLYLSPSRVRARARLLNGTASTATNPIIGPTWPYWLWLSRVGNVITSYYSVDGNLFTQLDQQSVPMLANVNFGAFLCAGAAGANTAVMTFRNLTLNNLPMLQYVDNTVSAGNTYSYTAKARDVATNESDPGNAVPITVTTGGDTDFKLARVANFIDGTLQGYTPTGDITVVTSHKRGTSGGTAVPSNYSVRSYCNHATSTVPKRAEISLAWNPPYFVPAWYGYSLFISAPWQQEIYSIWEIMGQFHPDNDAPSSPDPSGLNPSVSFSLQAGQPPAAQPAGSGFVNMIGDDRQPVPKPPTGGPSYQSNTHDHYGIGPVVVNAWWDVVWRIIWDYRQPVNGGIGQVQLWLQDTLIFTYVGQNCFNDTPVSTSTFLKLGQYRNWQDHTTPPDVITERELFFAEVRMGLESNGVNYPAVAPTDCVGPRP